MLSTVWGTPKKSCVAWVRVKIIVHRCVVGLVDCIGLTPPRPTAGSLLDMVAKAEVIIRGLYHAEAGDLEITLLHQEHSCNLTIPSTDGSGPAGGQFGVPTDRRIMQGFGSNPGEWVFTL